MWRIAFALALPGCTQLAPGDVRREADAGAEGTDAGVDGGRDAGASDGGIDAATIDSGRDGGSDAGSDGGTDAGAPLVFTTAAAGGDHTCAISGSDVYCWGDNSLGQFGDRRIVDPFASVPLSVVLPSSEGVPVELCAGDAFTCLRSSLGAVVCWGDNTRSQLGTSGIPGSPVRVAVTSAIDLACGARHACAVSPDSAGSGKLFCWGDNADEQVLRGAASIVTAPVAIALEAGATDVTHEVEAGDGHTCAIVSFAGSTDTRDVYCWGRNEAGQSADDPAEHVGPSRRGYSAATELALGDEHSCVMEGSATSCWGADDARAMTLTFRMRSIEAGARHTCGVQLDREDTLFCWGLNESSQLGGPPTVSSAQPMLPARIIGVSGGRAHTCAWTTAELACWGSNTNDQVFPGAPAMVEEAYIIRAYTPS
jgi:alpha-tubulin suppressor-like RCC1 family protein